MSLYLVQTVKTLAGSLYGKFLQQLFGSNLRRPRRERVVKAGASEYAKFCQFQALTGLQFHLYMICDIRERERATQAALQ